MAQHVRPSRILAPLTAQSPNPFNPETTIEFMVAHAGPVTLEVFDMLGRKLETLVEGELAAGRYRFVWSARGVASGMYAYRLRSGQYSAVKKLLVLR